MKSQHRDWGFKKMCLVAELQAEGSAPQSVLSLSAAANVAAVASTVVSPLLLLPPRHLLLF